MDIDIILDLRQVIDDTRHPAAFSDYEIWRIYQREASDYNRSVVALLTALMGSASKLRDYTQNASQDKRSQVFDHLGQMRAIWKEKVDDAKDDVKARNQVRVAALRTSPNRRKEQPITHRTDWPYGRRREDS